MMMRGDDRPVRHPGVEVRVLLWGVAPVSTTGSESVMMATNTTESLGQRHAYGCTVCDDAKFLGFL